MAVTEFSFNVIAGDRDTCLAEMDRIAFELQNMIGGDPWVVIDDDVARRSLTGNPSDDKNVAYIGVKKVMFMGPHFLRPSEGMPPGVSPQHTEKNHIDENQGG